MGKAGMSPGALSTSAPKDSRLAKASCRAAVLAAPAHAVSAEARATIGNVRLHSRRALLVLHDFARARQWRRATELRARRGSGPSKHVPANEPLHLATTIHETADNLSGSSWRAPIIFRRGMQRHPKRLSRPQFLPRAKRGGRTSKGKGAQAWAGQAYENHCRRAAQPGAGGGVGTARTEE